MGILGIPSLNLLSLSHSRSLIRKTHINGEFSEGFAMATPLRLSSCNSRRSSVVEISADNEDLELKQMRDMAAAKKRWDVMIREGKVKMLTPREAGYAIQLSNKTLLDVRPSVEHEKAWVKGSTWIPMFEVDSNVDDRSHFEKDHKLCHGGLVEWYADSVLRRVSDKETTFSGLLLITSSGDAIFFGSKFRFDLRRHLPPSSSKFRFDLRRL